MVQINTPLNAIVSTSGLPDNIAIAIDGTSAEVAVMVGDEPIFQTQLFAYSCYVTLYDLRSIMEDYLRSTLLPIAEIAIRVDDDAAQDTFLSSSFIVLYSEENLSDPAAFMSDHYLTTRTSFLIHRNGSQQLSWIASTNEDTTVYTDVVSIEEQGNAIVTRIEEPTQSHQSQTVCSETVSVHEMEEQITGRLVSFTVHRGQRSITFYVTDETPDLFFSFRNAFNVTELAALFAATTVKQKVEHSEANCRHDIIFYDRRSEYEYEVETAALPYEEALWLFQLLNSHDITKDGYKILISADDSEISNSDDAINRHKFTYRYARDTQPLIPPTIPQVFTEEFQSQFQ